LNNNKQIRISRAGGHSQVIQSILEENNIEITEIFDDSKFHKKNNIKLGVNAKLNDFQFNGSPFIIAGSVIINNIPDKCTVVANLGRIIKIK